MTGRVGGGYIELDGIVLVPVSAARAAALPRTIDRNTKQATQHREDIGLFSPFGSPSPAIQNPPDCERCRMTRI
jgi:hypothetical protein